MDCDFGRCHPSVNFIFFSGAIGLAMFISHPVFLLLSCVMSLLLFFSVKGKSGVRFLGAMAGIAAAIALLNPVFNQRGDMVLFYYLNGRAFTMEALCYGAATGTMFFTVCMWFASYNELMTSDKFLYLFGSFVPAVSLVLCMVLRFLPNLKQKAETTANARKCIGMSPDNGGKKERLEHGMTILSTLVSWALEGATVTADSMNSRGYGCGDRTNYAVYKKTGTDRALAALMSVCIAAVVFSAVLGGTRVQYMPSLELPEPGAPAVLGFICYAVFLSVPSIINIWEVCLWRILRSKI